MKIAYLILAHNNPRHLQRLLVALNHKNAEIYIHIDKKAKLSDFILPLKENVHILQNRVVVTWGGYSQVQAILNLLSFAQKDNPDYFILLSGTDYPIRSNETITLFLEKYRTHNFMNICVMPKNNKPLSRIQNYYSEVPNDTTLIKRVILNTSNFFFRHFPLKRSFYRENNGTYYAGSTWWALSPEAVAYTLSFIERHPEFIEFYKHTLSPDEMFFQEILCEKYKDYMSPSFTYSDWSKGGQNPSFLTEKHMDTLKQDILQTSYGKATILFARKFSDESEELINKIDHNLRK